MTATPIPEREWRGPGCTDACEIVRAIVPGRFGRCDLLVHSAAAHENYGRILAGPLPTREGVTRTGALVIDRWARTVTSYGLDIAVSDREWGILDYVAARLDRYVPSRELIASVWRTDWVASSILTTTIARLRSRLGASGHLIETSPGRGYRLAAAATDAPPPPAGAGHAWAKRYPRCVCCGATTSPHNGHGRCTRCQFRAHRAPHYGPCAAPPLGAASGHAVHQPGSDHDD